MICSTLFGGKDESANIMSSTMLRLRFLIILDNDDFQQRSCWFNYSKLDQILQNSHLFPGKLEVISYEQYTNSIHRYFFFVNDNDKTKEIHPQKNRVYVRICKEKKYIVLEEFAKRLVLTQLNELNLILLRLNAESAKIKFSDENHGIQRTLVGVHSGLDEYIKSMYMNDKDHDSIEIRFPSPTQLPYINESKYIYYEKWNPLIKCRLEEGKYFAEYFYKYEKPVFLKEECLKELRTCGILVYDNTDTDDKNFELHFEIFYYPDDMISM